MDEAEKTEFAESLKADLESVFGEKLTQVSETLTGLRSEIEILKKTDDPDKSNLENQQDKIKLDTIAGKLDSLIEALTKKPEPETPETPEKKSLLDRIFFGD